MDLAPWIELSLSQIQLYALAFLIGSFAVAALSDVRRMSAQREFVEVWLLAVIALFAYDVWRVYSGESYEVPVVRWLLIIFISIASHHYIGAIFSLARGDVMACAAAAALLSPVLIIIFYIILKLLDLAMRPFLRVAGSDDAYPFMPVVLVGTICTAALVLWGIPWLTGFF
jgi:hypothetical protein